MSSLDGHRQPRRGAGGGTSSSTHVGVIAAGGADSPTSSSASKAAKKGGSSQKVAEAKPSTPTVVAGPAAGPTRRDSIFAGGGGMPGSVGGYSSSDVGRRGGGGGSAAALSTAGWNASVLSLAHLHHTLTGRTAAGAMTPSPTSSATGSTFSDELVRKLLHIDSLARQLGGSVDAYPPLSVQPGMLAGELDRLIDLLETKLTASKTRDMDARRVPLCVKFWHGYCEERVACTSSHTRTALGRYLKTWLHDAIWEHLPVPLFRDGHTGPSTPSPTSAFSQQPPGDGTSSSAAVPGGVSDALSVTWRNAAQGGTGGSKLVATLTIAEPISSEAFDALVEVVQEVLNRGGGGGGRGDKGGGPGSLENTMTVGPALLSAAGGGHSNIPAPLRTLVVRRLTRAAVKTLTRAIATDAISTLQTLDISKCELCAISPRGVLKLAKALERNSSLTSLNVGYNHLGVVGALAIVQSLLASETSCIRWLNLEANGICSGTVAALSNSAAAASAAATSTGATMNGTGAGSSWRAAGIGAAGTLLPGRTGGPLSAASPSAQAAAAEDVQAYGFLCEGLSLLLPSLERLNIATNELGPEGVRRLLRAFADTENDKMARMSPPSDANFKEHEVKPGSGSAHSVASFGVMASSPTSALAFLDLSHTHMLDAGLLHVSTYMAKTRQASRLLYLNLGWNRLSTDGIVQFSSALAAKGQESDSSDGMPGGGGGGAPMVIATGAASPPSAVSGRSSAAAATRMPSTATLLGPGSGGSSGDWSGLSLQALRLHQNPSVGRKGVVALAELLKVNVSLTSLDLRWTTASEEGVASLGEALLTNKGMREILLSGNDVDVRIIDSAITDKLKRRGGGGAVGSSALGGVATPTVAVIHSSSYHW